jgi:serine/threonine protein kinase
MRTLVNPGDTLDHYRLDEMVSHNTTAAIFRATDLHTNRPVAIKIPDPEMESDPMFSDRFHREEEIGRTLDHPGLLKPIADDHRSQTYIVTEWFEGESLRHILNKQGKLSPERAIRITLRICDVLAYIHGHGVVHRDLKPENILVNSDDQVKLANFGTAAKTGARRITFANLGQVIGISKYISPEELSGKRGDVRSDVYAMGAILYEILTRKTPFQETDPFNRIMRNLVPPRELSPAVSPQLQEVIYRALEREPKNRYANAHELALDLTHLDHVGVAERPELKEWQLKHSPPVKKLLFYACIALIPIAILGLLLLVARR